MTRPSLLALAVLFAAAAVAGAQPLPPFPIPRGPFPGGTRPTVPPREAPRVEEEIDGAVRVAVLNLDRTALGALVESALRDKQIVNWWPRSATAKLLAESQLHAGLDLPPGPSSKDAANPPLPDAIVLVRTKTGDDQGAEVIVCEPGLGLRLGARRVQLSGEPAKDVAALVDAATSGLKKLGQKMGQLWAVPPFHSHDLGTGRPDRRLALAHEAETALLAQKGAFAVELEYAHVVAAARQLAGIEEAVARPLPRFLIGSYRHEPDGAALSVSLTIVAADAASEPRQLPAASPDEAAKGVRDAIAGIAATYGTSPTGDQGHAEKNLIAAVSREYQKEGNWRAALVLAETRLLLDPADREWRSQAIGHAAKIVREQMSAFRRLEPAPEAPVSPERPTGPPASGRSVQPLPEKYVQAVLDTLGTYCRAMQHLEWLATTASPAAGGTGWLPSAGHDFVYTRLTFSSSLSRDPDLSLMVREFHRRRQSLLLRMNELAAAGGEPGNMLIFSELPPEERRALVARMIVDFRLYPRSEIRNQAYINAALNYQGGRERAEEFLDQLATLSDPAVQQAVQQQRQRLAQMAAAASRRPAAPTATPMAAVPRPSRPAAEEAPDPDAQVVLTPLVLPWKAAPEKSTCELMLPMGTAGDLFCARGQILLSKKKGEYKLIWDGGANQQFRHMTSAGYGPSLACYDGKYAWVPVVPAGDPARLLVIDPAAEKVHEVTAKDGLPADVSAVSRHALLAATALEPGKVFLAGSFGRTWLGTATFDPEKGASVKVIHEARDLAVPGERDQHLTTTLAFDPTWLFTLRGKDADGKPLVRVLVGRYALDVNAGPNPLVVDPVLEKVQVLAGPLQAHSDVRPIAHDGALYWTHSWFLGNSRGQEVWRLSLPDLKPQSLAKIPLPGESQTAALAIEEEKVHLVGQEWQTAESWDEALHPLRGKIPLETYERRVPLRSEIHGWLLLSATQQRVHQVEFKDQR